MAVTSASVALGLAKTLYKEVQNKSNTGVDLQLFKDVVPKLMKSLDAVPSEKLDVVLKTVGASQKALRSQKRSAGKSDTKTGNAGSEREDCDYLLKQLDEVKASCDNRAKNGGGGGGEDTEKEDQQQLSKDEPGSLPSSVGIYLARLKQHKKELYKDPPVLPPPKIVVESQYVGEPKRNKQKELVFLPGKNYSSSCAKLLKDFHPNVTPEEVLRGGSFGGTYFRQIDSAVTGKRYTATEALRDSVPKQWIEGLDAKTVLTSQNYREPVNKYKVKCGGSLGMWESSGWISDIDPYGWFQWYCRFYQGRRSSDDERQISRWLKCAGPKGRFRSQLCNKIISAGTTANDAKISPVIRQTLFHWGLEITESIIEQHRKRSGR